MNKMKVLAMYLPQFHQIPENDEWWGEGFTDWVAAKSALPLVDGHNQPRKPLGENYYNLLDKKTMEWQAGLMEKYGIDGQCFYHYWFENGRKILEKPAENLLMWKDINIPFMFCWANVSWARTWSRISEKNVWADTFEPGQKADDSGILLKQNYGDEIQWREHFDYLLPFFKDERYIKIDNKPVFMINQIQLIPCLDEMISKWRQWAIISGFDGIYLIGINCDGQGKDLLDVVFYQEPSHVIQRLRFQSETLDHLRRFDYDEAWKELLDFRSMEKKVTYGGFVDYDDTPRRGGSGTFFENVASEKFKRYLTELLAKNAVQGNEMVFINAWNEWGEGMYLEPDERNGYRFLEAVPYAKDHYKEYLSKYEMGRSTIDINVKKEIDIYSAIAARYESYWRILDTWLGLKEANIHLEDYFLDKKIHSIAVYGIGMLGRHLLKELEKGKIEVKYAIDKKGDTNEVDIKVYSPEEELPIVDAIVVTATYAYKDISRHLQERGYRNVISLEEIIRKMA